jgi:hypothetical protein
VPGLSTPKQQNPFDFVQSANGERQYFAPTVQAVDKEIKTLMRRIKAKSEFPQLQAEFMDDVNDLLSRRLYLMTLAGKAVKP